MIQGIKLFINILFMFGKYFDTFINSSITLKTHLNRIV